MIVSITGGTGFIGRILALRHISQGDTVRLLSRKQSINMAASDRLKRYHGDLTGANTDLVPFLRGTDVLYHCAAEITNPEKMHVLHIDGTQRLISAASHRIGHWVQLSSTGVYGKIRHGIVEEDTPLSPDNVYERTKAESDRLVVEASARNCFSHTVLRPSNVYGPSMTNQSLFQLIKAIDRGLFFFIGTPGASANYIHVDNVVEALMRCGHMPAARGNVYIVSDNTTIQNFVRTITDSLGKPYPIVRLPETLVRYAARGFGRFPKFPLTSARVDALTNRVIYSTSRIQNELHYHHTISIEEGIRQLVKSIK